MGDGCLIPCPREVRKIWQKNKGLRSSWGWVSDPIPAKFGKYAKKQRSPNFMGAGCLVPFPREVRKILQKTNASELYGGLGVWSHSPAKFGKYGKKQRSPNFMGAGCLVPFPRAVRKTLQQNNGLRTSWCWVSGPIPPRSSENIAKNKDLRTSWGLGV